MSHVEVISAWDQYIDFPKKDYNTIFSEKLVNELHEWIETIPHILHSPQWKRLIISQN